LSWTKEADKVNNYPTLGYRIYSSTFELLYDSTSTGISVIATVNDLIVGYPYNATVRAVNRLGESASSNSILFTAGNLPDAMPTPYLISTTLYSIQFGWSEILNNGGVIITAFNVYYDIGKTGTYTISQKDINTKQFTLSGLTSGTAVLVKLSASNAIGEGPMSNPVTFYSAYKPATPSSPSKVKIYYSNTDICIDLSWTAPYNGGAPITGYLLYYSDFSINDTYICKYNGTSRPDILNASACNLTQGKSYRFKLSAINNVNASDFSDPLELVAALVPSAPLNVSIASSTDGGMTVKWD